MQRLRDTVMADGEPWELRLPLDGWPPGLHAVQPGQPAMLGADVFCLKYDRLPPGPAWQLGEPARVVIKGTFACMKPPPEMRGNGTRALVPPQHHVDDDPGVNNTIALGTFQQDFRCDQGNGAAAAVVTAHQHLAHDPCIGNIDDVVATPRQHLRHSSRIRRARARVSDVLTECTHEECFTEEQRQHLRYLAQIVTQHAPQPEKLYASVFCEVEAMLPLKAPSTLAMDARRALRDLVVLQCAEGSLEDLSQPGLPEELKNRLLAALPSAAQGDVLTWYLSRLGVAKHHLFPSGIKRPRRAKRTKKDETHECHTASTST